MSPRPIVSTLLCFALSKMHRESKDKSRWEINFPPSTHLCFSGVDREYPSLSLLSWLISFWFFILLSLYFLIFCGPTSPRIHWNPLFESLWPLIIRSRAAGSASHGKTGSPTYEIFICHWFLLLHVMTVEIFIWLVSQKHQEASSFMTSLNGTVFILHTVQFGP